MKKKILTILSMLLLHQSVLWAQPPQWSVDASQYEFSMTITGRVFLDEQFSYGDDHILAAEVDSEIRGVATPVYDQSLDRYLFFLTIFSNEFTGENVSFKYYDADADQVIDLWNEIEFASASNMGSISQPYVFFVGQPSETSVVTFIVEDDHGNPVTDALLTFDGQTMPAGDYIVEDVAPGTYAWEVAKEGYVTQADQLVVEQGQPEVAVFVVLQQDIPDPDPELFSVLFVISDPDGVPVSDFTLHFLDQEFTQQLLFPDLEPGNYPYQVVSTGFTSVEGQVVVVDANVQVQVTMQPVTGDPDPELYEVHFFVFDIEGNLFDDFDLVFNGEQYPGQTVISDLEPGVYTYQVSKTGYLTREGQVSVNSSHVYLDVVLIEEPLNVSLPGQKSIAIFPNPARDFVKVHVKEFQKITEIIIHNASGNQVLNVKPGNFYQNLDVSSLARGAYLVSIVLHTGEKIIEKLILH